jgi:hypothetical protein
MRGVEMEKVRHDDNIEALRVVGIIIIFGWKESTRGCVIRSKE